MSDDNRDLGNEAKGPTDEKVIPLGSSKPRLVQPGAEPNVPKAEFLYKIGDVVTLKSGGPPMTVTGLVPPSKGEMNLGLMWIDAVGHPFAIVVSQECVRAAFDQ